MATGTLLTVNTKGIIVKREPIWPFPCQGSFPRTNFDNTITYFVRRPYYNFVIGDVYHVSTTGEKNEKYI